MAQYYTEIANGEGEGPFTAGEIGDKMWRGELHDLSQVFAAERNQWVTAGSVYRRHYRRTVIGFGAVLAAVIVAIVGFQYHAGTPIRKMRTALAELRESLSSGGIIYADYRRMLNTVLLTTQRVDPDWRQKSGTNRLYLAIRNYEKVAQDWVDSGPPKRGSYEWELLQQANIWVDYSLRWGLVTQ